MDEQETRSRATAQQRQETNYDVCCVTRDTSVATSRNKPIIFELHRQRRMMIPPEVFILMLTHYIHTIDNYFSITHLFDVDIASLTHSFVHSFIRSFVLSPSSLPLLSFSLVVVFFVAFLEPCRLACLFLFSSSFPRSLALPVCRALRLLCVHSVNLSDVPLFRLTDLCNASLEQLIFVRRATSRLSVVCRQLIDVHTRSVVLRPSACVSPSLSPSLSHVSPARINSDRATR
jgi:hypothetical protein